MPTADGQSAAEHDTGLLPAKEFDIDPAHVLPETLQVRSYEDDLWLRVRSGPFSSSISKTRLKDNDEEREVVLHLLRA